jgi:serine/threonine protein kinase/formylglycine-generating enzyme required for sulfatase activity
MSATGNCIRCGRPADVMGLCQSCYDKRRSTSPASRSATGLLGGGRFRLRKQLGEGGMGSVWLAVDETLSRGGSETLVALKFLSDEVARNPQALDWLRNEVMTAKSLAHPNVVRVYDWHEFEGEPIFYSMEYVAGLDLRAHLRANRRGRFTLAEIEPWLPEILSALSYCHHHRVYHRDLKPANLILTLEGRIRLVDFGLAQARGYAEVRESATGLTRAYASPEQAMGNDGTAADDIYSLGAVLYHLLTGRAPAPNATETEDPRTVIAENGGFAKELPAEAALTLLRCLHPDRTQRPASVDEFAQWWRTGPVEPGATVEDGLATDGGSWLGKLLVVGVLIGLGFLAYDQWGRPDKEGGHVPPEFPPPRSGPSESSNIVHRVPLQLRFPTPASGSLVVGWSRWEQQTNVDSWTHSVPNSADLPEVGYFRTNLDLKPGTYRFTAQWSDRRLTNLSTVRHVTVGTNTGTLLLSLVPTTLDLRLKAQLSRDVAGPVLSLVSEAGQLTPLRLSDQVDDAYRLFHGEALPRVLPGKYRIDLSPSLREDWQVTEPAELEVPDLLAHNATIVLLVRRSVLIHRSWTNGSHVFVPVPGRTNLLARTTETTVDDFKAFAEATQHPAVAFPRTGRPGETSIWRDALGGQGGDHPIVGVSWEDAVAHAAWLTETHRAQKLLSDRQRYRLPFDSEWSLLTGGRTYPWGDHYPPASNEANLAGSECDSGPTNTTWPREWNVFLFDRRLSDDLTVPVTMGTSPHTPFLQLGGNASEWVLDDYREDLNPSPWARDEVRALTARFGQGAPLKVVRGGSWFDGREYEFAEGPEKRLVGRRLLSTTRWAYPANHRNDRVGYRLVIVEE